MTSFWALLALNYGPILYSALTCPMIMGMWRLDHWGEVRPEDIVQFRRMTFGFCAMCVMSLLIPLIVYATRDYRASPDMFDMNTKFVFVLQLMLMMTPIMYVLLGFLTTGIRLVHGMASSVLYVEAGMALIGFALAIINMMWTVFVIERIRERWEVDNAAYPVALDENGESKKER